MRFDTTTQINSPVSVIADALDHVRSLMDMDFCYISEASEDEVTFRQVSARSQSDLVAAGRKVPLDEMFCGFIAKGEIPNVVTDTREVPVLRDLPFIQDANVQSLISVPIYRPSGGLFGMFCCFSQTPKPNLNQRDFEVVNMFTNLASRALHEELREVEVRNSATHAINDVIGSNAIEIHLQPIMSLSDQRPVAVEALSRFYDGRHGGPMAWFQMAQDADMKVELELEAIKTALACLPHMPENIALSINASPDTIISDGLLPLLVKTSPTRIILEMTEHEVISNIGKLSLRLSEMRKQGIRLAIDDVGAGYAGLSTVLDLNADVLKLDRGLVSNIHTDPAKQSLTKAMVHFARETNALLIAEGIELHPEDATLRSLGVHLGQGFIYAPPTPALGLFNWLHDQNAKYQQIAC